MGHDASVLLWKAREMSTESRIAMALLWAGCFATGPAAATDVDDGRVKSVQCVACHGQAGVTANPTFPNLAGQNATYLAIQLEHFRDGRRHHPLMSPVAESLSEQDIQDLAMYFSRIDRFAAKP